VFWVSGKGLGKLYRSVNAWANAIASDLTAQKRVANVCAGFTRFGTYANVRAMSPSGNTRVLRDLDSETRAAHSVALDRLGIEPQLRDTLAKLGIQTLGQLVTLPPGGLLRRFGTTAQRLHALATGTRWDPPRYRPARDPVEQRVILDDPQIDLDGLVFLIKRALDPLLISLARETQALTELEIQLALYRSVPDRVVEVIKPAEPTLDARSLLRLVRLRLESSPPPAAVVEISLGAASVPATAEQLALFSHKPRRDLRAADEAIARIRAELGNDAVVKAHLRDAHLPEAQFSWERFERAERPRPREVAVRPLIRRFYARPILLPPQNQQVRDDGWILRGLEHGSVIRLCGPYIVSGGWWASEVHREYHYADTRRGECLWVFYDRHRRRWFLQGQVE
jgi:protein ImuB